MAVEVGNGSRVVISVRGAGLKGDPGEIPEGYLKEIRAVGASGRIRVLNDDDAAFYMGKVTAADKGDGLVEMEVVNPDGSTVKVAVQGGDDIVVLKNPTVFLRTGGSTNPPIVDQDDLTEDNAFNSMAAIRNFMRRTLTQGTLTIDGRGTYSASGDVSPAIMRASEVIVRGDETNPAALTFASSGNSVGIAVENGEVTVRDCTLRITDDETFSGRVGGLRVSGGRANLRGTIRFTGNYDRTKPDRVAGSYLAFASGTGDLDLTSCRLVFEMNSGHNILYPFAAVDGGRYRIGSNMEYVFNSNVRCSSFNFVGQSSYVQAYTNPNPIPVFSGSGNIIADYLWWINNLASMVYSGWNPLTNPGWPMGTITNRIADYCVIDGTMGKDL